MRNAIIPSMRVFAGVPTSVPFTYRDGMTVLQIIECLRHNLDELHCRFGTLVCDVNRADAENFKCLMSAIEQAKNDILKIIEEMQRGELIWCPTYGQWESVETAMGHVYDNDRTYGLFAEDYDGMGLTAVEYDEMGIGARAYDLFATDMINLVPGQFQGRDHFPGVNLGGGTETSGITQEQADARYVQRNPTCANFEGR